MATDTALPLSAPKEYRDYERALNNAGETLAEVIRADLATSKVTSYYTQEFTLGDNNKSEPLSRALKAAILQLERAAGPAKRVFSSQPAVLRADKDFGDIQDWAVEHIQTPLFDSPWSPVSLAVSKRLIPDGVKEGQIVRDGSGIAVQIPAGVDVALTRSHRDGLKIRVSIPNTQILAGIREALRDNRPRA